MTERIHLARAYEFWPVLGAVAGFAVAAHSSLKQTRKYTGEPYHFHVLEVADIVASVPGATVEMIAAALLHDVLEDTGIEIELLDEMFSVQVADMVLDLTDAYTPEAFPMFNRAERKQAEAERYAYVDPAVKTIKLADGLSNTPSIAKHDPKFMETYGPEKRYLLGHLRGGDEILWQCLDTELKVAGY